jgi:thiol-disulfide isomerase/thioredoxin
MSAVDFYGCRGSRKTPAAPPGDEIDFGARPYRLRVNGRPQGALSATPMNLKIVLLSLTLSLFAAPFALAQTDTIAINAAELKALLPNAQNKKPLLINFWATWCGPCRAEFPDLVEIDADYRKKGLNFALVSVDNPALIQTLVPEFLAQYQAEKIPSYLLDLKTRALAPGFRDVYPLTLLFDKNGKLIFQKLGRVNDKILREKIDLALKSTPASSAH